MSAGFGINNNGSDQRNDADAPAADDNNSHNYLETLRRANCAGKIPVKLTLGQTSLSSAITPQPQHVLLSRQTFLHLGLESSVRKLHEYALPTLSFVGNDLNNKNNNAKMTVVQEDDDELPSSKTSNETLSKTTTEKSAATAKGDENTDSSDKKEAGEGSSNSNDDSGNDEDGGSSVASSDSSTQELPPYPICWFEDVTTGQPLRWQYFAGVLFDSLHPPSTQTTTTIPWELRLHFQSYPSQRLLELCDPKWGRGSGVQESIRMNFRNSLKQAFVIRYGTSKEALNLSKQSHDSIWEGISTNNYDKIAQVVYRDDEFPVIPKNSKQESKNNNTPGDSDNKEQTNQASGSSSGSSSSSSSDINTTETNADRESETNESENDKDLEQADQETKKSNTAEESTVHTNQTNDSSSIQSEIKTNNLVMVPIRLSIDPSKPMIQKRCEGGQSASEATLGWLLLEWAPLHFERRPKALPETCDTISNGSSSSGDQNETNCDDEDADLVTIPDTDDGDESTIEGEIEPTENDVTWRVAGLTPPLSTPLLDLWLALRHPDNFLYISLSIKQQP